MRALCLLLPLAMAVAGCQSYMANRNLDDLSWGEPFGGDYDDVVQRARYITNREFPQGIHPEHTSAAERGDLWTVWRYHRSHSYRETVRTRAHVKVEKLEKGKLRVGVSVVRQLNDNIENPDVISEARWVNTERDPDAERRIELSIAQRYRKFRPSTTWRERHRDKRRGTLRDDIIEGVREGDVNLEEDEEPRRYTDEVSEATDRKK